MAENVMEKYAPSDFRTDVHYWSTFGEAETEISANWVIRFLQERNQGWAPFTYGEIAGFYGARRAAVGKVDDGFLFNRLAQSAIAVVPELEHRKARPPLDAVCTVLPRFVERLVSGKILKEAAGG